MKSSSTRKDLRILDTEELFKLNKWIVDEIKSRNIYVEELKGFNKGKR